MSRDGRKTQAALRRFARQEVDKQDVIDSLRDVITLAPDHQCLGCGRRESKCTCAAAFLPSGGVPAWQTVSGWADKASDPIADLQANMIRMGNAATSATKQLKVFNDALTGTTTVNAWDEDTTFCAWCGEEIEVTDPSVRMYDKELHSSYRMKDYKCTDEANAWLIAVKNDRVDGGYVPDGPVLTVTVSQSLEEIIAEQKAEDERRRALGKREVIITDDTLRYADLSEEVAKQDWRNQALVNVSRWLEPGHFGYGNKSVNVKVVGDSIVTPTTQDWLRDMKDMGIQMSPVQERLVEAMMKSPVETSRQDAREGGV